MLFGDLGEVLGSLKVTLRKSWDDLGTSNKDNESQTGVLRKTRAPNGQKGAVFIHRMVRRRRTDGGRGEAAPWSQAASRRWRRAQ